MKMQLSLEASAEIELRRLCPGQLKAAFQLQRATKRSCKLELSVEASAETELRKLPRAELPELYFSRCFKGSCILAPEGNKEELQDRAFRRGVCGNGAQEAALGSFLSSVSADASGKSSILQLLFVTLWN